MISVNLTIEQLESIHCALYFMAQYHDKSEYLDDDDAAIEAGAEDQQIRLTALDVIEETLGKTLELVPTTGLAPEKFYLVDRSEMHCGGLERIVAGPLNSHEECTAERIGWHDGRYIVAIQIPASRLQA